MRHLISYLLFVGIPLAGLLGVLRVGQGIPAAAGRPRLLGGAAHGRHGRVCTRYLLSDADSTLIITQSGRQLTGTLGPGAEVGLKGSLTGDEISLEGVIEPGPLPATSPARRVTRSGSRPGSPPLASTGSSRRGSGHQPVQTAGPSDSRRLGPCEYHGRRRV